MRDAVKTKVDEFYTKYPQRHFRKGQILIHGNDEPPGVFSLEKGQIREYDITESGSEVVINVFKDPAILPASWAVNRTPNRHFFECFTDVKLRMAPTKSVETFLKNNPDVAYDLLRRLYSGLQDVQRRMAYMMGGSTQKRVLLELVLECQRFGVRKPDGSYVLKLHEDEIANRAGLSRETVSRHIAKFNHGKLIKANRKSIVVSDLKALEKKIGDIIS